MKKFLIAMMLSVLALPALASSFPDSLGGFSPGQKCPDVEENILGDRVIRHKDGKLEIQCHLNKVVQIKLELKEYVDYYVAVAEGKAKWGKGHGVSERRHALRYWQQEGRVLFYRKSKGTSISEISLANVEALAARTVALYMRKKEATRNKMNGLLE